jgi:hypothetical protein
VGFLIVRLFIAYSALLATVIDGGTSRGLRLIGMEAFATKDLSLCFFSIRQSNE